METLLRRTFRNTTARYAIVGALIGALALVAFMVARGGERPTLVLEVQPLSNPNEIRVYVGGAVATPGLYTLPRGSRVAEALDAAGGPAPHGDTSALGMSAPLEDADQIIVPTRPPTALPTPAAPANQTPTTPASLTPSAPAATETPTIININSADATALDTLPGIGPALAARIIAYRQSNGPFQSVDELAEVKGISPAMVEEMRPRVTVGP